MEVKNMNLTLKIPDDIAGQLGGGDGDLARRALEGWALEEYKRGALTEDGLRRMFGFGTRYQLDGFLKAHEVWAEYTVDDFRREVESLKRFGL